MSIKINTVMLVDDDKIGLVLMNRLIERSGLVGQCISFLYADEALEHLKTTDRDLIDVIFLDINMPRMNGFEFLDAATEQLGSNFARAVVVMLTTSLRPEDMARARGYEVVREYINKPVTLDDLHAVAALL